MVITGVVDVDGEVPAVGGLCVGAGRAHFVNGGGNLLDLWCWWWRWSLWLK